GGIGDGLRLVQLLRGNRLLPVEILVALQIGAGLVAVGFGGGDVLLGLLELLRARAFFNDRGLLLGGIQRGLGLTDGGARLVVGPFQRRLRVLKGRLRLRQFGTGGGEIGALLVKL